MFEKYFIRYSLFLSFIVGFLSCQKEVSKNTRAVHAVVVDPPVELLQDGNSLVLLTRNPGQIGNWGSVALIAGDTLSRFINQSLDVSQEGWLLCGRGEGADWMSRNLFPGVKIHLDMDSIYVELSERSQLRHIRKLLDHPYGVPSIGYHDEAERFLQAYRQQKRVALLDSAQVYARYFQYSGALPYFGIHGVWWDIRDPDSASIRQAVLDMVGLGIQVVFPKVISDGYAIYPDAHPDLPQDPRFDGWDPLALLMDLSKKYPISFVPWVQVYQVGLANSPVVSSKSTWLAKSRTRKFGSERESGSYFFCPSEPAVDAFWIEIYQDLVNRYGFNSIQLDCLRYPVGRPWEQDYCYCDRCTRLFKKEFGVDPLSVTPTDTVMWRNWDTYRLQQVNRIMRHIHEAFPNLRIGVDVIPDGEGTKSSTQQDWHYWVERGWIQALFPLSFTADTGLVRANAHYLKERVLPGTTTMIGLGPSLHFDAMTLLEQIDIVSAERLDGFVLFEWNALTPEMKKALKIGPFRYY